MAGARRQVGLEENEPPAAPQARGGERRGELARMVGVVVDDRDAPLLADRLEATAGAGEPGEHVLRVGARHAGQLERGQRGGGIPAVVLSGHGELERDGLEPPAPADVRAARGPGPRQLPPPPPPAGNVGWWSGSRLGWSPTRARRARPVRSGSSAWATSHPSPAPALP